MSVRRNSSGRAREVYANWSDQDVAIEETIQRSASRAALARAAHYRRSGDRRDITLARLYEDQASSCAEHAALLAALLVERAAVTGGH